MAKTLLYQVFILVMLCFMAKAWWPFESGKVADPPTEVKNDNGEKTGEFLRNSPVPFEMSVAEQKFLAEAQRYMGDMSALDQCHQVIITRLRKSCHELGEEEIGKLAVSLFNCQSKAEGRALFYCSEEMSLRDCTSGMDPDAWNAYHIISNRARSVCYATRNQQFRLKTEYLVNQLALTANGQMDFLEKLKTGQENLNDVTKGTLNRLTSGHRSLIQEQVRIRNEFGNVNKDLTAKMNENMVALNYEKRIIKEAEEQLSSMTEAIAATLGNTTAELREQDEKRKEEHAAVVEDLEEIKAKTVDTWEFIDEKTSAIRERQDETLDHHENIIENLHRLNDTIGFILESIKDFETRFDVRLSWLASQFGGAENRLGCLTTCFGHFLFFVAMTMFVLFINGPTISRVFTLILVPFNAWVEIKLMAGMSYMTMTMLILAVVIGHYAFEITQKKADALKNGMNNLELGSTKNYIDSLPPPEPIGPCTPFRPGGGNFSYYNNSLQEQNLPRSSSWACEFNRSSTPNPSHAPHHSPSVTFNTTEADNAKRHLNLTAEQSTNTTISTTTMNTPSKRNLVSNRRCGARTKQGSACKRKLIPEISERYCSRHFQNARSTSFDDNNSLTMPLFKKKIYNLTPSPKNLKPGEELFVIPETNEGFRSYDEYIAKVFLYSSQNWSCQYTGKSGLTYNNALLSEKEALKQLKTFPEHFKEPVLNCIHKAEGNVKEVAEKCIKFLTNHYCLKDDVVIVNAKNAKTSPGVIIDILKNVDFNKNKENDEVNATVTQVSGWKYSVQLARSDVVVKDLSPHEIKRTTKLPSKGLLRIFIKHNAERVTVDAKDMWFVKDHLVQKYKLPAVAKPSLGLKKQKNLLRSPLDTITGSNSNNVSKQKTKKISPKNIKDPSQRTINFFVQTPTARTNDRTTPTKDNISEKRKGSPVVAELNIALTPKSKIKEVIEKSSEKSDKCDSVGKEDGSKTEGKTARSLFTVEPDVTEDKVDEVSQITIEDEEDDFVSKKQSVKPDKEKNKDHENPKRTASKSIPEKIIETNLKKNENDHSNKLDNVDKVKVNNYTKHDVVTLDDDFSEKEKKIVKKNALKKQKTLSQMFKVNTSKSSSKIESEQEMSMIDVTRKQSNKENVLVVLDKKDGTKRKQSNEENTLIVLDNKNRTERDSVVETSSSKNELGKTFELASFKTGFELVRHPLPSPKLVSAVPEQLRRYYGDILMITEFIHFYGNFLCQDRELKCSPDDLVSGLMNECPKNQVFVGILIGFLQVLLKDLQRQDSSKEFSDLGVSLLDMTVSESTVGELTKLYLQYCHHGDHSNKKKTNRISTTKTLDQHILMELNKKDIVDLTALQKLEVLTYLLDQIVISDVFYSHHQELEETRRQTWLKKIEVDTEIRELIQQQMELEDVKNPQKEIDNFLEKCDGNSGEKAVDNGPNVVQDKNMKITESNPKKDEEAINSNLTTRQEIAAKSKIEKEKNDEMRRLSEQLYQKKQKNERFKEVINQVRECRRLESLGSDRNQNRYWLFYSHPEALFVQKMASSGIKATEFFDIEDSCMEESWFYYNTKAEIDRLISSLSVHDENENSLKQKLKTLMKQTKKLHFEKRQTDSLKSGSEEDSFDHLGSLKGELCDLASRITEGEMGCVENLEIWAADVMSRTSFGDLATLALDLASAVKIKSLWKKLGDREEWLKKDWVQAVKDSMTSSRLCFCVAMLDYCIMWDTSTLYIKCKVCRRSRGTMAVCDKCRKGYHIECLRPALDDVPDEEWLCPVCRPADEQSGRRAVKKHPEIVDEESQQENDDYCDVCGGDGELICCDNCPKVYHKECHDPPLRNIPRGLWQCCSCQGRRPTAKQRSLPTDHEEYSDFESSQAGSDDDSSYSESSSEESQSDVEDTAAVERADRAKRRELAREKEAAKNERSKKKNKKKGKKRGSLANTEDKQKNKKKCPETIGGYLNEGSYENENSVPKAKQASLRSNEENTRCSSRKRKCSSSEDDCPIAKRKPRQNSELKMCENMLKDLMHHEDSWPFTEPVDTSEVPDYLEIVTCPMDFGTIKRKLNTFEYNSYEDCINDIKLVFANSDQYNLNTSDHGLAGISLEAYFKEILPNYFPKYELQALPQKSSRRKLPLQKSSRQKLPPQKSSRRELRKRRS